MLNILLAGRGQQPSALGSEPGPHGFVSWTGQAILPPRFPYLIWGGSDSCLQGALGPGMAWQSQPPLPSTWQAQLTLFRSLSCPHPLAVSLLPPLTPLPGPLLAAGTQVGSSIASSPPILQEAPSEGSSSHPHLEVMKMRSRELAWSSQLVGVCAVEPRASLGLPPRTGWLCPELSIPHGDWAVLGARS